MISFATTQALRGRMKTVARERKPTHVSEKPGQWQAVYEDLKKGIISGKYRSGVRLVEDSVIETTGATRHAVRKAFDEIARLGLAIRYPNRGVQVRSFSRSEILDIYEVRECLELKAIGGYTEPAEKELVEKLKAIVARHEKAVADNKLAEMFNLNNLLHGNFGPSYNLPDFTVGELFAKGLPISIQLGASALVLALLAWCFVVFVFDLVALGVLVSTKSGAAANEIEFVCDATHVNAAADLHSAYDNVTDQPARSAAVNPTPSIGWLAMNPVDLFRALNLPQQIGIRVPALTTILAVACWLIVTLGASLWRLRRADL